MQLADEVVRSTRAALAAGIGKGDRAAVWAPNSAEWVIAAMCFDDRITCGVGNNGWVPFRTDTNEAPTVCWGAAGGTLSGFLQFGHVVVFHVGWRSSGLPGLSKVTSSGSVTGSSATGAGTTPHFSQWMIGIGQPQ